MPARAHLRIVARDTTGAIQASTAVTFYEADGTTPFAGSLYAAVSGGIPVTTHTTNSSGVLERWTDAATARPVKLTVAGVSAQVNATFALDPRDIILQGGPVAASINGYDGTGWAQTVKALQDDSGVASQIARFLDSSDAAILRLWRSTGGNLAASINLLNDTIPTLNTFEVRKASGTTGFVLAEFELQATAGSIVQATVHGIGKQTVSGISNVVGVRGTAERSGSASATGSARGVEGRIKTTVAGLMPGGYNAAVAAITDIIASGVAPDAWYYAGGLGALPTYVLYAETSASAHIASLGSTGVLALGATPATTGQIRLPNATGLTYRNAANDANLDLIRSDGSNNVLIGAISGMAATALLGTTALSFQVASNVELLLNTSGAIVGRSSGSLAFYGGTPVTKPSAYTQTYSTADKTHAAATSATLTDNSGGSAGTTLSAITGGGAACENATKNAVASLAAQVNALRVDLLDVKQLANAIIDDLQAVTLVG